MVDIRAHLGTLRQIASRHGFADTPEGRALDSSDGVVFLPKPFARRELTRALDEAFKERAPGHGGAGP